MVFHPSFIQVDNVLSQVSGKRRYNFGQWMNLSIIQTIFCSLIHKKCHMKSYHSDIKCHMTLIIKFGVAVPDILVNSILNYCCMFAFHISIMVPNACTHHVHGILIYNHLHNGYMASTNNNSWSISVHMFKKLLNAHF